MIKYIGTETGLGGQRGTGWSGRERVGGAAWHRGLVR